ncbi:hypothetical protein TNCV_2202701 [Trichonephila clavipes]|nr:hypothetical protein TNCV_2202701 [Trichonephila clavipes]
MGGRRPLRYSFNFAFALFTGNRDYTGMWVRRDSTNLMAGKVVFLRGLLSPIRVVDLMLQKDFWATSVEWEYEELVCSSVGLRRCLMGLDSKPIKL